MKNEYKKIKAYEHNSIRCLFNDPKQLIGQEPFHHRDHPHKIYQGD